MKKNLKYIVLLVITIILLIMVSMRIYKEILLDRFVRLLLDYDSKNYEIVQTGGDEITTIKVKGNKFFSSTNTTGIWISKGENKRVVMDKVHKTAIITENPNEKLEVNSLNYLYIKDYFKNKKLKFRYLGEKEDYYIVEFTNKSTGFVKTFYIDKIGFIKKEIENYNGAETILDFEVTCNCVKDEDVAYPNLADYKIGNSSSTVFKEEEEYNRETAEEIKNIDNTED